MSANTANYTNAIPVCLTRWTTFERPSIAPTHPRNLALACAYCNAAKGPNVAGYDPSTDELVPLFDPRTQKWADHFLWRGPVLEGKTSVARATIDVLRINTAERIDHRKLLNAR